METQLVFPCGPGGNSDRALGLRIRETFETQSSAIGSIVLKVQGLLNTKTGTSQPPLRSGPLPAFGAYTSSSKADSPATSVCYHATFTCCRVTPGPCRYTELPRQPEKVRGWLGQGPQCCSSTCQIQIWAGPLLQQARIRMPHPSSKPALCTC